MIYNNVKDLSMSRASPGLGLLCGWRCASCQQVKSQNQQAGRKKSKRGGYDCKECVRAAK